MRKMVLKLAGATFPIMTNPIAMRLGPGDHRTFEAMRTSIPQNVRRQCGDAARMVSFNLILVMSLVLHLLHRPYVKDGCGFQQSF